jgi:hypothetical protein
VTSGEGEWKRRTRWWMKGTEDNETVEDREERKTMNYGEKTAKRRLTT